MDDSLNDQETQAMIEELTVKNKEITPTQLAEIIERVHKAIDNTGFGPMITYGGTPEKPTKIVSQVASAIFTIALTAVLSKLGKVQMVDDEQPSGLITSVEE